MILNTADYYAIICGIGSALSTFCYLSYYKEDLFTTLAASVAAGVFGLVLFPFFIVYIIFKIPHFLIGILGEKHDKN